MRVLVSAYSCETGRGSEGEIGWRLVHQLAESHDIVVITRANLRPVHEAAFVTTPKPARLSFVYFDLPWIFRFYKRGKRFFLIYYYLWQIGVGLLSRRMMRQKCFDVLHHLVGGMDWMPAGLALCPGPFIWGPVGSEDTHPVIRHHLTWRSRLKDGARALTRWTMRTLDPFVRLTGHRACVVLSHTAENMPRRYAPKLRPFVQTGISNQPSLAIPKSDLVCGGDGLRIVYAGELKDWKGARLACQAALRFFETDPFSDLTIVGDGPLRNELEAMVQRHPQGHRVRFLGRVPMPRLVEALHMGDLFLYPSFHHGLATVVLQAMLTGLPIVCIEGDAIGRAVGQTAGLTVSLTDNRAPAEDLACALTELAANEPRRRALGEAARTMAREQFSYETLGNEIAAIYAEVATGHTVSAPARPAAEGTDHRI